MTRLALLFLAMTCAAGISFSQTFNNTYTDQNQELLSRCIALVPNSHMFVSADAYPVGGGAGRFMITKVNSAGNFLQALHIDTSYYDHRILETGDSGLIVAAYLDSNLYVLKFSKFLALQWGRQIPMGVDPFKYNEITVDIEKGLDSSHNEVYYILSGSPTTIGQYINDDAVTSVVKLSHLGGLIWHKKYTQAGRTSSGMLNVIDIPHSLTPVDSNNTRFVIGGTRQEVDADGAFYQSLYYLGINSDGQIFNQYTKITTADVEPWSPEAVWDSRNNTIASTYRETNYNFSGDPTNILGIGFLSLDNSFNPLAGEYYYQFCTNFGNSITLGSDTSYTIGCYTADCDTSTPSVNPAFLKINNSNFAPIYYNRYNIDRNGFNWSFHRNDAQDNNYMVPFIEDYSGSPVSKERIIKADNNGSVCGEHSESINMIDFTPVGVPIQYNIRNFATISSYKPPRIPDSLVTDTCDSSNPDWYRLSSNQITERKVLIYPTLIVPGTSGINCDLTLEGKQNIHISVRNTVGQVIFKKSFSATEGFQRFMIPCEVLTAGLNVVYVTSDSEILKVEKILKQ